MAKIESYKLKDGKTEVSLSKEAANQWVVEQWDADGNSRWSRIYRKEEDAKKEFDRWRDY